MITPLSQALTVAYASSLLKKDGGFKEAVEKVFRENYKNEEEAFAALKEFWVGNRSFRALFSVFLSRGEVASSVYGEGKNGEPVVDEQVKQFTSMTLEEKCKNYPLVYPYLGDLKQNLETFSFHRPAFLRRLFPVAKELADSKSRKSPYHLLYEPFDLGLPSTFRPQYLRRVLSVGASQFRGYGKLVLPAHAFSHLDDVARQVKELGESLLRESEEEDYLQDPLAQNVLQANYRAFAPAMRRVYQALDRGAQKFLEAISDNFANDPAKFAQAIHNMVDLAFYSSMGAGGMFPVISFNRHYDKEANLAIALFSLLLLQVLFNADMYLSGLFIASLSRSMADGEPYHLPANLRIAGKILHGEMNKLAKKMIVALSFEGYRDVRINFASVFGPSSLAGLFGDSIAFGRSEEEEEDATSQRGLVYSADSFLVEGFNSVKAITDFLKKMETEDGPQLFTDQDLVRSFFNGLSQG